MSEESVSYGKEPKDKLNWKYRVGDCVLFHLNGVKGWAKKGIITAHARNGELSYQITDFDNISTFVPESDILELVSYGVSYVASAPTDDEPSNVHRFTGIVNQMAQTYKAKNADYGDSFGMSIEKYGVIAGLTRISDKFNRLENLILTKEQKVSDEKIGDTLLDLANYAVMLYMAMNCDISDVEFEKE